MQTVTLEMFDIRYIFQTQPDLAMFILGREGGPKIGEPSENSLPLPLSLPNVLDPHQSHTLLGAFTKYTFFFALFFFKLL